MILPEFTYEMPSTLRAAFHAVGEGGVPYCGGTELLAAMSMGLLAPDRLVSLRMIDALRLCKVESRTLLLGATMTHREVARSPAVADAAPLLRTVAGRIGNVRVRSTGTVGGNLAFAEPRSDLATALIALGASVVAGPQRRAVPIEDFVVGPYETDLAPGELLIQVEVPAHAADVSVYRKVVFTERPVVGVAMVRLRDSARWRVVVGAVGDRPLLVDVAELRDLDLAGVAGEVDVSPDLGGTEIYKRHLTRVTLERCRDEALAAAEGCGL